MTKKISEFISNTIVWEVHKDKYFAGIIGESPSKGARSPILWNTAFANLGMPVLFFPFDVSPKNLENLVKELKQDEKFIGGSVAVPYKIEIAKYLDSLDPKAEQIGAVNCLARTHEGKIIGYNTDGAGFTASLDEASIDLKEKNVLMIGAGGAARAVGFYCAEIIGKNGTLRIMNRAYEKGHKLAGEIHQTKICPCTTALLTHHTFTQYDAIINCTSVGSRGIKLQKDWQGNSGIHSLEWHSPLAKVPEHLLYYYPDDELETKQILWNSCANCIKANNHDSLELIDYSEKDAVFIDIVYDPLETTMLRQARMTGRRTLNGKGMNLHQAVIAFMNATENHPVLSEKVKNNYDKVKEIMRSVP